MFQEGFPKYLRDDLSKMIGLIPIKTYSDISIGSSQQNVQYIQDGLNIEFPHRIYYVDISDEDLNKLGLQQKMILHCIYSRSCDGFVRQKHLKSLLLMDYANWAIPYIVKICDEYVVEILEMVYEILKEQDTNHIKKFCIENVQSFCKSYARMSHQALLEELVSYDLTDTELLILICWFSA